MNKSQNLQIKPLMYSHQVPVQEVRGFRELRVFQVIQETQNPLGDLGLQESPAHPEINTIFAQCDKLPSKGNINPNASLECHD